MRPPLAKMGWWCSDTARLAFVGCRVPAENLIGEENEGFRAIMENFNGERLLMASAACAFAAVCFDEARAWAQQRKTFGQRLVEHQAVRHKLVDMRMRIFSTRAWIDSMVERCDAGTLDGEAVAALVRAAGAPVVCETPGGVAGQGADITWLRTQVD